MEGVGAGERAAEASEAAARATAAAAAAGATAAAAAAAEEPKATTTTTPTNADNAVVIAPPAAPAPPQDPPAPSQPHEADKATVNNAPAEGGEQHPNGQGGEEATKADNNGAADSDAPASQPPQPEPEPPLDDEALLASFFAEVKAADRDAEVNRILGAFKLNPYEQLGARFDADAAELGRAYRKSSLLVHPDKCSHPRASDAFDLLGAASAALRDGAKGLEELRFVLGSAREQLRAERRKEAKRDGAARLAALVVDGGAAGVQAAWERSDQFHERWRALARDLLARNEFKRRKLTLRLKETEERLADEAKAERKKAKTERKSEKAWEKTREGRVGAWRDFAKKGGSGGGGGGGGVAKKKSKPGDTKGLPSSWNGGVGAATGGGAASASNGASASAASTVRDPERSYVRRPGGENF